MAGRDALVGFVDELQRLRQLAGSPSLKRLAELAARSNRSLPRSTTSDKLTAKSLPDWDFVVAFVSACAAHAESIATPLAATSVDLKRWERVHWRLLQAVDSSRTDERLAAASRIEQQQRRRRGMDSSGASPAVIVVENEKGTAGVDVSTVPRQLPVPPQHFVGRRSQLASLTALAHAPHNARAVAIAAIVGTAGIGKTALAVHWAHSVADQFPDGQLYVNLRGFDPAGTPVSPSVAVRGFLDGLGIPPGRLPADLDAQVGLYRSLLSGRRVLVVLDNALDVAQVRPLLPGAPGSVVVVTSRNRLAGLIAVEGAHPITLDLLATDEAKAMLAGRLGVGRVASDPAAVRVIVSRCARLPLALAVVAARAGTRPSLALSTLAGELSEVGDALDATTISDDVYSDARAVFSWSYHALSPGAGRLFRLFGLHPGPDISVATAVSLAALPQPQVRRLLAELTRAHLVEEHIPGRFSHHDLLRAYAAELVQEVESRAERRNAVARLLDHYLHTAYAAERLLHPQRQALHLATPAPGAAIEQLDDDQAAMNWLSTEYPVLLAAFDLAAREGFDTHVWQLAWALATFFERRGRWHDWADTHGRALAAAQRLADQAAEAYAHRSLARADMRLGRYLDAHTHLRTALRLFVALGDDAGQAHTHHILSDLFARQACYPPALSHSQQAFELYQTVGNRTALARTLNSIGWYHAMLGNYHQALQDCQQALILLDECEDRFGQAAAWDSLGYTHQHLRRIDDAVRCYQQAVDLFRAVGAQRDEADTWNRLGDTHAAASNRWAAQAAWRCALAILDELGHGDADAVRGKLKKSQDDD